MKLSYLLEIKEPHTHKAHITVSGKVSKHKSLNFYIPSWSPGSYLMREYGRHLASPKVINGKGEYYQFEQITKNTWKVDFENSNVSDKSEFFFEYDMYCHEIGVRNSYIDDRHAFLHPPSLFMGIEEESIDNPNLILKFPPLWSKVTTGMKEIGEGNHFEYTMENFDDFLDCPIEIGCHETDGFMAFGKPHHLAWVGDFFYDMKNLKEDIKTIVEHVGETMGDIPYDVYTFITQFGPKMYGGLEHKNSTALHFDGRTLNNRKDYINWLALVAHEYFHTWNVKRIRPIELGPFDYQNENYTRMLWLAEGLTSFMDELFVYRSGLCSATEYLDMQTTNFKRYFDIHGRKFHSLEDSSFNAWVKLYRPDENSKNSSISYYLKGGMVFMMLHFELLKSGKNINDLLSALWDRYKADPSKGMTRDEFLDMVEGLSNKDVRGKFEIWISTTEELDYESSLKEIGVEFEWEESTKSYLGVNFKHIAGRVYVNDVLLDGPAYKQGLNAGDEIIAINGQRILAGDEKKLSDWLKTNQRYTFKISRMHQLMDLEVMPEQARKVLKNLKLVDADKFEKAMK